MFGIGTIAELKRKNYIIEAREKRASSPLSAVSIVLYCPKDCFHIMWTTVDRVQPILTADWLPRDNIFL